MKGRGRTCIGGCGPDTARAGLLGTDPNAAGPGGRTPKNGIVLKGFIGDGGNLMELFGNGTGLGGGMKPEGRRKVVLGGPCGIQGPGNDWN